MLDMPQEKELIKIELEDSFLSDENSETKSATDLREIEFEIITPIDFTDKRKVEIYNGISEIDESLVLINEKVNQLNTDIDKLTSHTDGLDYMVAVASGIIAGAIDIFYVGEFSLERGKETGHKEVNNFVIKIAQKTGYSGDDLQGAIRHLEDNFKAPSDSVTAEFGGGLQHHLRDFAHHPTPIGLCFSLLTQFTGMGYGTDTDGVFKVIPIKDTELIGETIPEKIFLGVIEWFLHMVSDIAGSNAYAGQGTGLPGPVLSLLKELSSFPIFNNSETVKELRKKISKLFNGTLLAKRDENGKIMKGPDGKRQIERIDLRAEIGIAYEIGRQSIPVIVNESLVRGLYFLRRLTEQLEGKKKLRDIDWKKTIPFNNRTIVRMLTIATGTFMAIDLADAGVRSVIKSNGLNPATAGNFILRINFVGVGRFAIAVGADTGMGVKKNFRERELMNLKGQELHFLNAKLFYKEANMWIAAEDTEKAISEIHMIMEKTTEDFVNTWNEITEGSLRRKNYIDDITENNGDLAKELSHLLEWGTEI